MGFVEGVRLLVGCSLGALADPRVVGPMSIPFNLLAILLLLAANGFFVAAEFALVKAKGFQIETAADAGSKAARLTLRILADLEAHLAACQLGITMASLGLGWIGEPFVASLLAPALHGLNMPETTIHTVSFLIGFVLFSSLHIVVGEQVPKTLAIRKPEPVSLWCAYPLRGFHLACYPLNWALNKATASILKLVGVSAAGHEEVPTADELRRLLEVSTEHGQIETIRAGMMHGLFDFDSRMVAHSMIARVQCRVLDLQASPEENLEILRDSPHSRFPVLDGGPGHPVGVLLVRDLHHAMIRGVSEPWAELGDFVREPLLVPETQRIASVFERMRTDRSHMALVVDEYGTFAGMVTLEDLLEEIVGEISDETDVDARPVATEKDGCWEVSGLASLHDVARETGLELEIEPHLYTLSGLFMERLQRVPEPGDELQAGGFLLRVLSVEHRHVALVHMERIDEPEPPPD